MSTRGQVVDPYYVSPAVATPRAERAVVNRPSLTPGNPPAWWWGIAPGAMGGSGAAAATPAASPPTSPSSSGGGCCGS